MSSKNLLTKLADVANHLDLIKRHDDANYTTQLMVKISQTLDQRGGQYDPSQQAEIQRVLKIGTDKGLDNDTLYYLAKGLGGENFANNLIAFKNSPNGVTPPLGPPQPTAGPPSPPAPLPSASQALGIQTPAPANTGSSAPTSLNSDVMKLLTSSKKVFKSVVAQAQPNVYNEIKSNLDTIISPKIQKLHTDVQTGPQQGFGAATQAYQDVCTAISGLWNQYKPAILTLQPTQKPLAIKTFSSLAYGLMEYRKRKIDNNIGGWTPGAAQAGGTLEQGEKLLQTMIADCDAETSKIAGVNTTPATTPPTTPTTPTFNAVHAPLK